MQNLFKRAVILLVLCLLATNAEAQLRPVTTTLQNAVAATGDGSVIAVDGFSTVGVQVTISNTATVTFEATQNLSTWQAVVCTLTSSTSATLVSTATATGTYQCGVAGMVQFRARVSAYTSGTVTVTATASPAVLGKKGGGSGGGLASTDIDTCAEFAAIMTGETGTCGNVVLSQGPTIADPVLTGSANIPNSITLPATCAVGNIYMDTDATTGQRLYLCESTNTWALQGDGGAGTGMTHPQTMARASLGF